MRVTLGIILASLQAQEFDARASFPMTSCPAARLATHAKSAALATRPFNRHNRRSPWIQESRRLLETAPIMGNVQLTQILAISKRKVRSIETVESNKLGSEFWFRTGGNEANNDRPNPRLAPRQRKSGVPRSALFPQNAVCGNVGVNARALWECG